MKKTRQEKFETAVDIASWSSVVVFLTCPWALYFEALQINLAGHVPATLLAIFNFSLFPFILGLSWLCGRYRKSNANCFYKFLDWRILMLIFAFMVVLPIYLGLQHKWPVESIVQHMNKSFVYPGTIQHSQNKGAFNLIMDYFPLFLMLIPIFVALFRWCDFGNWHNALYLSFSLPGVIGISLLFTFLGSFRHAFIFNVMTPIIFFPVFFILFFEIPYIFLIVASLQLFFIARRKQLDSIIPFKPRVFLYCTLIVFAYFWIPYVNNMLNENPYW